MAPVVPVYYHSEQNRFFPRLDWDEKGMIDHPEVPDRAGQIVSALSKSPEVFVCRQPDRIPMETIEAVHHADLLTLLRSAEKLTEPYYITQFPHQAYGPPDPTNIRHAGYYCQDTSTPLDRWTWTSAAWSAASAVSAAQALVTEKSPLTYALCRPPGHHASATYFGGFCYLNNAALSAHWLKKMGSVAVLDIDYHHGDGTQAIFYRDPQVLYVSLHADPKTDYPYYSGYARETGEGPGEGFTLNLPLPQGCTGEMFLTVLNEQALPKIKAFAPQYLIVSAGFDTFDLDPLGHFTLQQEDYEAMGKALGQMGLPVLVVQEGGYHTEALGRLAKSFLMALADSLSRSR